MCMAFNHLSGLNFLDSWGKMWLPSSCGGGIYCHGTRLSKWPSPASPETPPPPWLWGTSQCSPDPKNTRVDVLREKKIRSRHNWYTKTQNVCDSKSQWVLKSHPKCIKPYWLRIPQASDQLPLYRSVLPVWRLCCSSRSAADAPPSCGPCVSSSTGWLRPAGHCCAPSSARCDAYTAWHSRLLLGWTQPPSGHTHKKHRDIYRKLNMHHVKQK